MENSKIVRIIDSGTDNMKEITTDGYILLYLDGGKLRASGEFDLGSLAPLLMRLVADKMSKGT